MLMSKSYRDRALGLLAAYLVMMVGIAICGSLDGPGPAERDVQTAKQADCSKARDWPKDEVVC